METSARCQRAFSSKRLETFLSGMETQESPLVGVLVSSLETFLSGMETFLEMR